MLNSIFIDLDDLVIDLNNLKKLAWKKSFQKVFLNSKWEDEIANKLITKTFLHDYENVKEVLESFFTNEVIDEKTISYLIENYETAMIEEIQKDPEQMYLNLNLLSSAKEFYQKQNINFYLLNQSKISNFIVEKSHLLQDFSFLKLAFPLNHPFVNSYLNQKEKITKDNILNLVEENLINLNEIILVTNNKNWLIVAKQLNIFTATTCKKNIDIATVYYQNEDFLDWNNLIFQYYSNH